MGVTVIVFCRPPTYMQVLRLYSVPRGTFDEDESDSESEDEDDDDEDDEDDEA